MIVPIRSAILPVFFLHLANLFIQVYLLWWFRSVYYYQIALFKKIFISSFLLLAAVVIWFDGFILFLSVWIIRMLSLWPVIYLFMIYDLRYIYRDCSYYSANYSLSYVVFCYLLFISLLIEFENQLSLK